MTEMASNRSQRCRAVDNCCNYYYFKYRNM